MAIVVTGKDMAPICEYTIFALLLIDCECVAAYCVYVVLLMLFVLLVVASANQVLSLWARLVYCCAVVCMVSLW